MAVRDRNLFAWQAYVITMAFLSVGLLLGMFFLWRSYSDLSTRYDDQGNQLTTARSQFQTADERVKRMKAMLGDSSYTDAELEQQATKFADDEELATVEKAFAQQMALFPPTMATKDKNLTKLPEFLLGIIRERNGQIDSARKSITDLEAELTATLQRETQAREAAVTAQKKAEADLEAQRQAHAAERTKLNSEKDEALAMYAKYKADYDRNLNQLRAENQNLVQTNTQQAETIQVQSEIINQFRNPDFAAPQGKIVRVSNGGSEVWINLGIDDGLRVGVPFSVIDESALNISEAEPKARLVVTRVVDKHLCVAKISNFDYRRPVVTGDKVYSPAWRPGRTVGFALVGMMDINGDGKDDSDQVKELIRISGAKIDESMDAKNNRDASGGGMSPNTSFLVMGTDLTLPAGASPELQALQKAKAEKYAKFIAEARQMGIIQISLDKLMGYLKTEGSDRTIPLGNRIRAEDFPIRPDVTPPTSRGKVSEIFTPRSP